MDNGFDQMNNMQQTYMQNNVGQPGQPFMQQTGTPYAAQTGYMGQPDYTAQPDYTTQLGYMGQNDYMDQTGYMGQSGYMQPGYAQPNPYEYSQPVQPGFTVPTYAFQNGPAKYPQYDTTNGKRCTAMEVVGLVLAIVSVTLCLITLIFGFASIGAASSYNRHRARTYTTYSSYTYSEDIEIITVGIVLGIINVACAITAIVLRGLVYHKADVITGKIKAAFGMAIPSLAISALGLLFSVISVFSIM